MADDIICRICIEAMGCRPKPRRVRSGALLDGYLCHNGRPRICQLCKATIPMSNKFDAKGDNTRQGLPRSQIEVIPEPFTEEEATSMMLEDADGA